MRCVREALRENPAPQVGCGWWLAGGNSAGLVSSLEWCVFFPPLTWQAVKCGSLWCVQAADCIHAHRSRQPLIHWMTSHKRDKPVQAVVTALQRDMNRLFLRGFAYPALFSVFTVNKPQASCRYLLSAVPFFVFFGQTLNKDKSDIEHQALHLQLQYVFYRHNLINCRTKWQNM